MILTWKWPQRFYGKRYILNFCRNLSSHEIKDLNTVRNSEKVENDYITIYKFPYIKHASALSRLKKYHLYLSAAGIPSSFTLVQEGIIQSDVIPATIYCSLSIWIVLITTSLLSQRLIGFIYFNKKKTQVKVAYLDFWGNRKEKEIELNDVIPFSDASMNYLTNHLYSPFHQFSDKEVLKINLKYGQIINEKIFSKVFLMNSK